MGKKIWIWLFAIIGMVLSTVSGPVYGVQLAINLNDPMLHGRPISGRWTGDIMGDYLGFEQPGEIIIWETKKIRMAIAPDFKNDFQCPDITYNPYGTICMHNWATKEIFSIYNLFSSKKNQTEKKDDTSEPPPLRTALWICGFGIIGILSVRRTSDHSNVT